jgi:hypothetical protein
LARQTTSTAGLPVAGGPGRAVAVRPRALIATAFTRPLERESAAALGLVALALLLGGLVRAVLVYDGDPFPLNDGGMFYAMVEDIKAANYVLPEMTSYNGGDIPFAYPPLPFYAAAALSDAGGWSTLSLLQALPLLFSILTIPAFFFLARAMLPSPSMAGLATLIFSAIPRGFNWELAGGGLTRSPGLFFAVLALWQGYLLFQKGEKRYVLTAGVLSALTVLCHMEMGWFVAFSLGFFWLRAGFREHLPRAAALAGLVLGLTSVWWIETIVRTGHEPLLAALQTGSHSPLAVVWLLSLNFTEEPMFPVALALGLLGALNRIQNRDSFLPLWILLIFILDPRKGPTFATIPLAVLAAYGLHEVVRPMLTRRSGTDGGSAARVPRWGYVLIGFLLVVYAPIAANASSSLATSPLRKIAPEDREAMAWVKANTDADSSFIVVPSSPRWWLDATAEWFPALAGRTSLNTVQGTEWLAGGVYGQLESGYSDLVECTAGPAGCLDVWADSNGSSFAYVYVTKGEPGLRVDRSPQPLRNDCCEGLRASLSESHDYELVFENTAAAIYRRQP